MDDIHRRYHSQNHDALLPFLFNDAFTSVVDFGTNLGRLPPASEETPFLFPYEPSPDTKFEFKTRTCEPCRNLTELLLTDPLVRNESSETGYQPQEVGRPHHSTKQALLASASDCAICRLIVHELEYIDYESYRVETYWDHPAAFWVTPKEEGQVPSARVNLLRGGLNAREAPGRVVLENPKKCRQFIVPVCDCYPATAESMRTVINWIETCNLHPVCAQARRPEPLPKRVLDISDSDPDRVVLYESAGEIAPYVAASYCWGTATTLKTTRTTLWEHFRGIRLAEFPRTLREAIVFSRGLGFRYIWIDALCIIQDDDLDWAEQSSNMTAIYSGCALNIVVADAPNSDAGAARKWRDYSVQIGRVPGPSPESKDSTSQDRIPADIYAVSSPANFYGALEHNRSRVSTRGWIFQETLVSIASVYITHHGLIWECATEAARENEYPAPAPIHFEIDASEKGMWTRDSERDSRYRAERQRFWEGDDDRLAEQLRPLYQWVAQVSRRRLSEPRDRLPCIAGLASHLAQVTSASYVAGLWKEDLAAGLTWYADDPGTLTRHTDRGPSWSWASVDGPVSYHLWLSPDYKYPAVMKATEGLDLEVLDAWAEEVHPGTFGEVRSGRIAAYGTMWPATLRGKGADLRIDCQLEVTPKLTVDESRDWGEGSACWFLRIMNFKVSGRLGDAEHERAGIEPYILFLVVEESGAAPDEFRRIGCATFDCWEFRVETWVEQKDVEEIVARMNERGVRRKIVLV